MDFRHGNPQFQPETSQRPQQRFSWQPTLEEEAPAYEQQAPPRAPRQQTRVPTNVNVEAQDRHFSYAQTPIEHEAFFYVASTAPPIPHVAQSPSQSQSPCTPIDPRPQSVFNPLTAVQPQLQLQTAQAPPVAQPQEEKSGHARRMTGLSPINTSVGHSMPGMPAPGNRASPLPYKTPMTPISSDDVTKRDGNRGHREAHVNEPYTPHGFGSHQANNLHAVFSPDAAHGPNGLDFALHQPGQTTHPNMDTEQSPEWTHSLCSCMCGPDVSTCLTGLLCPCILYGRTAYRLSQKSAKKDATDLLGHSAINAHCMMMGVSCGLWWLFPMLQRIRIRRTYKLGGGFGSDFLKGCCCCCCVAVQNEREVKSREEASNRWAGPASTAVYTRPDGMVYKPQQ
jgi:Cys-rich protein (TIGR01571 family)